MLVCEEHEVVIRDAVEKRAQRLRHLLRTCRVAIDRLLDLLDRLDVLFRYAITKKQVADKCAKGFSNPGTCSAWLRLGSLFHAIEGG